MTILVLYVFAAFVAFLRYAWASHSEFFFIVALLEAFIADPNVSHISTRNEPDF